MKNKDLYSRFGHQVPSLEVNPFDSISFRSGRTEGEEDGRAQRTEIHTINSAFLHNYDMNAAEHFTIEHIFQISPSEHADVHLTFNLAAEAHLIYRPIILGGNLNLTIIINLNGVRAHATIKGAYVLHNADKVVISTLQHHKSADGFSALSIHGVIDNTASIEYNGMIKIDEAASGTDADQQNKTIVLSPQAHARSIPGIEVLNHDVRCAHGSAISYLDEVQLMYAASRGMNEATAQDMLVRGFLESSLEGASVNLVSLLNQMPNIL